MRSHELFGSMPVATGTEILEFAHETDKKLYRATLEAVATFRKLRPVFLERQSRAERTPLLLGALKRPELGLIADNLIRHWLLEKHASMLGEFLTALGIPNNQGVVEQLPASVGDGPLRSAVDTLLAKYPSEAVLIYLHAFNEFNQAGWENLNSVLQQDPRFQFNSAPAKS